MAHSSGAATARRLTRPRRGWRQGHGINEREVRRIMDVAKVKHTSVEDRRAHGKGSRGADAPFQPHRLDAGG